MLQKFDASLDIDQNRPGGVELGLGRLDTCCMDLTGIHESDGGFKTTLSVGVRLLGDPFLLIERQQLVIDRGDVGDQFRLYSLMSCHRLQIGGFRSSDTASDTAPEIGFPVEVT